MEERYIVIFDGTCNFCNSAVNFVISRDPSNAFCFTPMQSDFAQSLIQQYGVTGDCIDTLMVVKNKECFIFSSAALEIAKDLSGLWYFFTVFKIIPRPIRDWFYKVFARNRYRLFGMRTQCMVPSEEVRNRFIGLSL